MKYIELSQGKRAIVDDEDYYILSGYKWYAAKRGYSFYAQRNVHGKMQHLHRVITRAKKGEDVDHINGDTLDNRRSNLRTASRSQNEWNRKKQINNSTGYKGVSLRKDTGMYMARIRQYGKLIYLGSFKDLKDAAVAYNIGAQKLHGEFALLNEI